MRKKIRAQEPTKNKDQAEVVPEKSKEQDDNYKLEYKGDPSPENTTYVYDLTVNADEKNEEETHSFNAGDEYANYFGSVFSGFLGVIATHHRKFAHDPKVQSKVKAFVEDARKHCLAHSKAKWAESERARVSLLKDFVNEQRQLIQQCVSEMPMLNGSFKKLKGLELVLAIENESKNEDETT